MVKRASSLHVHSLFQIGIDRDLIYQTPFFQTAVPPGDTARRNTTVAPVGTERPVAPREVTSPMNEEAPHDWPRAEAPRRFRNVSGKTWFRTPGTAVPERWVIGGWWFGGERFMAKLRTSSILMISIDK